MLSLFRIVCIIQNRFSAYGPFNLYKIKRECENLAIYSFTKTDHSCFCSIGCIASPAGDANLLAGDANVLASNANTASAAEMM